MSAPTLLHAVVRTLLVLAIECSLPCVRLVSPELLLLLSQVLMQLWMLSSFILDSLAVAAQSLVAVELGKVSPHQGTCLLCLNAIVANVIAYCACQDSRPCLGARLWASVFSIMSLYVPACRAIQRRLVI